MREGSLDAPIRHPVNWQDDAFWDEAALDEELHRVFDICHGCRRCFNLCDSFPRLFDLIDESETGELDSVSSDDFGPVVEACTLCDMCFMTKCPYVPPHEFNLDFPHLMLRARAIEDRKNGGAFVRDQLAETDRNGRLLGPIAPLANWGTDKSNKLTRPVMDKLLGIDAHAELPKFHKPFDKQAAKSAPPVNETAPAFGKRKAVLYATCFVNYNDPDVGDATRQVLAVNGVETEVVYPACCGMPHLEGGKLEKVADQSDKITSALMPWIDKGYDVIALTASCSLMLKFEWPLLNPDDERLKTLAGATFDIDEYVVDIAKTEGLADGLTPIDGGVAVHQACHARAQNMGTKAAEMLRLIPDAELTVVEKCSGHGGTFGVVKPTHEVAVKVGKNAVRAVERAAPKYVVSDCPLAAKHLAQGVEEGDKVPEITALHPIEVMAKAFGLIP